MLKRILSSIIWGQIGKIFEFAFAIAFTIFISRELGPSDYGIYTLIVSIIGLAILLTSFGFGEVLGKNIPLFITKNEEHKVIHLFKYLLSLRFVFLILFGLIIYFMREWISEFLNSPDIKKYLILVSVFMVIQGVSELFTAFYTALLKLKVVSFVKVTIQVICLFLTFVFFKILGASIFSVFYALIISFIFGLFIYFIPVGSKFFPNTLNKKKIDTENSFKILLNFGIYLWLINIFTIGLLGGHIDSLLISFFTKDTAQVGYYGISARILITLHILITAGWWSTLMPVLSEVKSKYGIYGMAGVWSAYSKLLVGIFIPALVFIIKFSNPIIVVLFGIKYMPAVILLKWYAVLTVFFMLFTAGLSAFTLCIAGKEKLVLFLRLIFGLINVILDIILIPIYGALGAVLATGISIAILGLVEMLFTIKHVQVSYPYIFVGKILPVVIASIILTSALLEYLSVSMWLLLFLAGVVYCIFLIVGFVFVKPLTNKDREILTTLTPKLAPIYRFFG